MKPYKLTFFIALMILAGVSAAHAASLTASFTDPVGDQTGNVDVVGVVFNFDNTSGVYEILLTADAANPFVGVFRINFNLFNPDTGSIAQNPSFFQDQINDFNLQFPTTSVTLTGTNARLLSWDAGDRVATNSIPFGNPSGVAFFESEVVDPPFGTIIRDSIAFGDFTTIALVPEQSTMLLLGFGLAGLGFMRRRRKAA